MPMNFAFALDFSESSIKELKTLLQNEKKKQRLILQNVSISLFAGCLQI